MEDITRNQAQQVYDYLLKMRRKYRLDPAKRNIFNWQALKVLDVLNKLK